jgi:hypothetical protein
MTFDHVPDRFLELPFGLWYGPIVLTFPADAKSAVICTLIQTDRPVPAYRLPFDLGHLSDDR